MIRVLRSFSLLAVICGGLNAFADSSICISSLLRDADEQAQLRAVLELRVSAEDRARIIVREGAIGLSECAQSGATRWLILAHGGEAGGDARITFPVRGVDFRLPWSALDDRFREAVSMRQIQIAVCGATQIRAQYEARGNSDSRLQWIEATSVGEELALVDAIDRFARSLGAEIAPSAR